MTMITEDDLEAADQTAARAAVLVEDLQDARAADPERVSQADLAAAAVVAQQALAGAEQLRRAQARQQTLLAGREAAERAAGGEARAAAKRLAGARDRASAAIAAAEAAMVAAVTAVADYDAAIREAGNELVAAGLPVTFLGVDREVGGIPGGGLRVDGTWWMPIEPGVTLMWSVHRVAEALLGARHGATWRVQRFAGTHQLPGRADGLVDAIPPLAPPLDVRTALTEGIAR